jgi:hypothetical protein
MTDQVGPREPDPLAQLVEDARRLRPLCTALCCLHYLQRLTRHRVDLAQMDMELEGIRREADAAWARLESIDGPAPLRATSYLNLSDERD